MYLYIYLLDLQTYEGIYEFNENKYIIKRRDLSLHDTAKVDHHFRLIVGNDIRSNRVLSPDNFKKGTSRNLILK